MGVIFRKRTNPFYIMRVKKKFRIRKKLFGTKQRPRLCVFRSNTHIYAQIVDDITGQTLVSYSSLKLTEKKSGKKKATKVGEQLALKAKEKNIQKVVFDRNGYLYHGKVKALADGARVAGLIF